MSTTINSRDPELGYGADDQPVEQNKKYLVLSSEERQKGFVRPVMREYIHAKELGGCGAVTRMSIDVAETYARNPKFYGSTYCVGCKMHRLVGENGEFFWLNAVNSGQIEKKVGT